jgi:hypothetical protein
MRLSMKKGCAQGLVPSKHPITVPLRRKTKRDWRGTPGRDQSGDHSNTTKARSLDSGKRRRGKKQVYNYFYEKNLHDRKIRKEKLKQLKCL